MRDRYRIIPNFFPEADALRRAFEAHFADPDKHTPARHQIWNYWYVPRLYTYLRTAPEKIAPRDLVERFHTLMRTSMFETYGLSNVYWPYLSLYVAGCEQGLHNDAAGGRLGYIYSLTRWDQRTFSGGETLLFKESAWTEGALLTEANAGASFYDLIPQHFNQLLLFDDRVPHLVPRLEGGMDPVAGRVVMHGHVTEGPIVTEGGIDGRQAAAALTATLAEIDARRLALAQTHHGLMVLRVLINAEGRVERYSIPFDRVLPLKSDIAPFEPAPFVDLVVQCRFPAMPSPSRITIPIAIGRALG
jgi:hypothetical protein